MEETSTPRTVIIAAIGDGNEIGRNGEMPWRLPSDLRRFKQLTLGHTVIMGRVTYDSIITAIGKPLPDRESIVLTHRGSTAALTAASLPEAISMASKPGPVFIIGGAAVYEAAFPIVDELWLTRVDGSFPDADRFFPTWDETGWTLVKPIYRPIMLSHVDLADSHATAFCIWRRQAAADKLREEADSAFTPPPMDSGSAVNLNHARSSDQRAALERITTRGECPFCPGNLAKEHHKPILYDNGCWQVTENQWPYSGTRHHLLLILKRHAQHANDLTTEEQVALFDAVSWANRNFGIEAAGLVMRYGDTSKAGSTVTHLHAHIVEPYSPDEPEFEDVRVWISGKKK